MSSPPWSWTRGEGPLLATAIHAGHDLREEVATCTALDDAARLREEDPHTDVWTDVAATRVVVHRSRFEVDLNRTREGCVYRFPEECWGLQPWRSPVSDDLVDRSQALYDRFYRELEAECDRLVAAGGVAVVLDLHSYNHRRLGPGRPPAVPADNPEVNLGTETADRGRWGALIERFVHDVSRHGLDVRENVRFCGAELAAGLHHRFAGAVCVLAVDVKKIFMDEHSGAVDLAERDRIHAALAAAVPGLLAEVAAARDAA